ncbi:MFS transporter, DHA2 family, methylenomycin A resistance protein [Streptomyces sp. 2323.1]|uniref:MFS transporter n=1 Tax=Streptomyces TaxID=1883 RepID=UPI000BB707EE|nr:MFS transporter [Streptomyces sp. 2323.1]SOE09415.1 MFS transporter, DHA2 family, methylenomycin A resistance protein [Streptomyces sp. 2323.1]
MPTFYAAAPPRTTHRNSPLPLVALCLGYFMVILDVTVVTVALPAIGAALHAGVTGLQWVVDGYTLVCAGLLLFCGGLGDRLGGKTVFLGGLLVFTLASAGCALAPTVTVLVAARLVQGLGAALMVPASLALLRTAYPERAARARAFGIWGTVAGLAAAAGPVLGGVLVTGLGWRSVFLLNLPVGLAALLLALRHVPHSPADRTRRGLDLPAQTAAAVGLACLTTGCIEAGALGWTHPAVLGAFAGFVCGALAFLVLERRARAPMLPLALFRIRAFAVSAVVGVLLNTGFYGLLFLAPLYFQQVHHYSALRTGCALVPAVGVAAFGSALSGRLTARAGPRLPMMAGLLVGAAGLLGWLAAGPDTPWAVLAVPMAGAGFGSSLTMPAATSVMMEAAPGERGGVAAAVFNTARQTGSALGVALFGTLVATGLVPGLHLSVLIGAAGFLTAAALSARWIPGPGRAGTPDRP